MYGKNFYRNQINQSYDAARITCEHISKFLQPKSVIDIGCGKATWLKAFKEKFDSKIYGVEGHWITGNELVTPLEKFWNKDLNLPLNLELTEKVDIGVSLEVAEHLLPASSESFVQELVKLSDCILFSAAQPGQGGIFHYNEKLPSEWYQLFNSHQYVCFDVMRTFLSNQRDIPIWYRQNMCFYVREKTCVYNAFLEKGVVPLKDAYFLDMVSTEFYVHRLSMSGFLKYHVLKMLPSRFVAYLHGFLR